MFGSFQRCHSSPFPAPWPQSGYSGNAGGSCSICGARRKKFHPFSSSQGKQEEKNRETGKFQYFWEEIPLEHFWGAQPWCRGYQSSFFLVIHPCFQLESIILQNSIQPSISVSQRDQEFHSSHLGFSGKGEATPGSSGNSDSPGTSLPCQHSQELPGKRRQQLHAPSSRNSLYPTPDPKTLPAANPDFP